MPYSAGKYSTIVKNKTVFCFSFFSLRCKLWQLYQADGFQCRNSRILWCQKLSLYFTISMFWLCKWCPQNVHCWNVIYKPAPSNTNCVSGLNSALSALRCTLSSITTKKYWYIEHIRSVRIPQGAGLATEYAPWDSATHFFLKWRALQQSCTSSARNVVPRSPNWSPLFVLLYFKTYFEKHIATERWGERCDQSMIHLRSNSPQHCSSSSACFARCTRLFARFRQFAPYHYIRNKLE